MSFQPLKNRNNSIRGLDPFNLILRAHNIHHEKE
jgi:hypothetical protein